MSKHKWFSPYDNFKYFTCFKGCCKTTNHSFQCLFFNLRKVSAMQHRWSKLISTCTTSWSLPGPSSTSSTALPPSCHGPAVDTIGIQVGSGNQIGKHSLWAVVFFWDNMKSFSFSQELMHILTWTCRSLSTENCVDYYGENATNITSLNATSPVIEFWE